MSDEQWIWSETNDGWYCSDLDLQMAEIGDGKFEVWKKGRSVRFAFFPTPEQVEATFNKKGPLGVKPHHEANVRRYVAKYGRKSLGDHLRDLGWSSNNEEYFEAGGIQLIKLNRMLKFRLSDGTKMCCVSFPLTPEEARRALNFATKPNQTIFLRNIRAKRGRCFWEEKVTKKRVRWFVAGDVQVREWKDGLWLAFPNPHDKTHGTWAWARLGFFPSPIEAFAAIKLSPTKGLELAPCYSRNQIAILLEKEPSVQEKQAALAAEVHAAEKGELLPCQRKAYRDIQEHPAARLDPSPKMHISKTPTPGTFFDADGNCDHLTCSKCGEEVSCMEAAKEIGPNTYHRNCWRQMSKGMTAKEFGEAVHRDFEEKLQQPYTPQDVEATKKHYDRCPKCHVAAECGCDCGAFLKEWEEAEDLRKIEICGGKPTWGISNGDKSGYYWVVLDFEPTVREAKFCLQLSEHRGKKPFEGSPITRKLYAALSNAQAAHEILKREGYTYDQKVLDRWEARLNGTQTYDEFVSEREAEAKPKTSDDPVFKKGDVVDVLDDLHHEVVVGRGRIVDQSGIAWIVRYHRRGKRARHGVLLSRLRKVSKEEL